MALNTLARVLFERGDVDAAIATQTKALEILGDAPSRPALEGNLARYEAAKG